MNGAQTPEPLYLGSGRNGAKWYKCPGCEEPTEHYHMQYGYCDSCAWHIENAAHIENMERDSADLHRQLQAARERIAELEQLP